MTLDLKAADYALTGFHPFPSAVTASHEGRSNGLIVLSAANASVIFEAPRIEIGVTKYNFSHDLILGSGLFAVHVLGNGDLLEASLHIIRTLGGSSGRDGDKMSGLATKPGVTGAPILLDALAYVEGRVVGTLDLQENTLFVADVLAAERLHGGSRLSVGEAWRTLPPEWVETYERSHLAQVNSARRQRGLPEQATH